MKANVECNRSRHTRQTPTNAQTLPVPIVGFTLLAAVNFEMMNELNALRPIIGDKNFTLDEKIEMLEAAFEREYNTRKKAMKEKAIAIINDTNDFDKRDARIIIQSL